MAYINGNKVAFVANVSCVNGYTDEEMQEKYDEGYDAGYDSGMEVGNSLGQQMGFQAGLEEGKQAEYDAFWDAFQNYGTRTNYNYGFAGLGWTDENFKPKYDIIPTGLVSYMFAKSTITDFQEAINKAGITFSTKKLTSLNYLFYQSGITKAPIIDASGCTSTIQFVFNESANLVEVPKIILPSTPRQVTNLFSNCSNLVEVRFEGVIGLGSNTIMFKNNPKISVESLLNTFECLQTNTSTSSYTLSIGSTNLAKLTDAEKAIATQKGWTLV